MTEPAWSAMSNSDVRLALDSVGKIVDVMQLRCNGVNVPGFDKYSMNELARFLLHYGTSVMAAVEETDGWRCALAPDEESNEALWRADDQADSYEEDDR